MYVARPVAPTAALNGLSFRPTAKEHHDLSRHPLRPRRRGHSDSSWFLPRLVGVSRALDWTISGRVFDAAEAERGGLVRSIHPPEDLLAAARALAREWTEATSAVSVALTRQLMWKMLGAEHPFEAHKVDSRGIYAMGISPDCEPAPAPGQALDVRQVVPAVPGVDADGSTNARSSAGRRSIWSIHSSICAAVVSAGASNSPIGYWRSLMMAPSYRPRG